MPSMRDRKVGRPTTADRTSNAGSGLEGRIWQLRSSPTRNCSRNSAQERRRRPRAMAFPHSGYARGEIHEAVLPLRNVVPQPFKMLYDLTAIDERGRRHRDGQPASDFTVVYHLFSYERNAYVRLKVPLSGDNLTLPSIVDICPAANWYEREVWDMFGIVFEGHPHLSRILMPRSWEGHPLQKGSSSSSHGNGSVPLAR